MLAPGERRASTVASPTRLHEQMWEGHTDRGATTSQSSRRASVPAGPWYRRPMRMIGALGAVGIALSLTTPVMAQGGCDDALAEARRLHESGAYHEAANAYVAIALDRRECGHLDEVLYNAAIDYDAARLVGRGIQVRQVLLRNFPDSVLGPRATYLVASGYHRLAIYASAAEWYEQFARGDADAELPLSAFVEHGALRQTCTDEERPDPARCAIGRRALENAVFMRLGMGEREAASTAAALYVERFRASRPEDTGRVVFSTRPPVSLGAPIGDPAAVEAFHTAFLADFAGVMAIDVEARSRVELARALLALDRRREAEAMLDRLRALVTPEAIDALPTDESGISIASVRARDAAEEGLVLGADLDALELPRAPAVSGSHDAAGVRRWATSTLARWVTRAMAAITERERAYAPVTGDEGTIPHWGIAARERVGALYRRGLAQGREIATPAWADDDELGLVLQDAIDEALRPLADAAARHYQDCASYAERVRWFSEDADRCTAELDALSPHHRSSDELIGSAEHLADGPVSPRPVDRVGAPPSDEE